MYVFRGRDKRERGPRGYMPAGVHYWAATRHGRGGQPVTAWAPTAAQAVGNLRRRYRAGR